MASNPALREAPAPFPWRHVLLLIAVAAALVALRGVRWDEDYEFAQVIAGQVAYPAGHPLPRYVHGLYSVQPWSLAGLMWAFPGPLLANALRNVLFLAATLLPPFLLAHALTGRVRWGYAAAALALLGPHVPFYSGYPVMVWPGLYSNGHIGGAWMLLGLYALATGRARAGFALAALAPAVHLGQAPPLLAAAGARLAATLRARDGGGLRGALVCGGAGVVVCALFWCFVRAMGLPAPGAGPYFDPIAPGRVLEGFMRHFASHRSLPFGTGHIALIGALYLSVAASMTRPLNPVTAWIAAYVATLAAIVYGTMLVHYTMGDGTPAVLLAWMPYRLINHAGILLIPLMVAVLARSRAAILVPAALGLGMLRPILALTLPHYFYMRYVANSEAIAFILFGAAAAALWQARERGKSQFAAVAILGIVLCCMLALTHRFGVACVLLGALAAIAASREGLRTFAVRLLPVSIGVLLAALAWEQWIARAHLPVSAFEQRAAAYLRQHNPEGAPVPVHYQQEGLQARLHQPIMTDMATMTWIPYMPSLGPSLYRMYRDLYGVNFAPGNGEAPTAGAWFEAWPAKSRDEWRALAQRYNFRYVLAPAFMKLQLDAVLEGEREKLYEAPR